MRLAKSLATDACYYLAALALAPWLLYRVLFTAKHRAHALERFGGVPKIGRDGPPVIWIHAVSVGEALAAQPLIRALRDRLGDRVRIALSATTKTGREVARERYPDVSSFQYPLDLSWACARALRRVSPCAVVLMELELWPNFVRGCAARGVPVYIANGRLTAHSARGYRRYAFALRGMFAQARRVFAQTDEIAARFRDVGARADAVEVAGSLKFDAVALDEPAHAADRARFRGLLGASDEDLVLVAGSTHPPEHQAVVTSWRALREAGHAVRLVIAPRHPERRDEVRRHLEQVGTAWVDRSTLAGGGSAPAEGRAAPGAKEDATPPVDTVVILDTIGELAAVYAAADVAFVGGSLIPHGGQNMIEACAQGAATVFGPHVSNFRVPAAELVKAGAAVQVSATAGDDARELGPALLELCGDAARRTRMVEAARSVIARHHGAATRTAEAIAADLDALASM